MVGYNGVYEHFIYSDVECLPIFFASEWRIYFGDVFSRGCIKRIVKQEVVWSCVESHWMTRDCDLLIHEATYPPGMEEEAEKDGHSTPIQAANTARKVNAKYLALIHLPYARLGPQIEETYLSSAKKIFSNTFIPKPMDKFILEGGNLGYKS